MVEWLQLLLLLLLPVMLMGTMSVATALAVCLIFSSGVGRGAALHHTAACPSTSELSSPAPPAGLCGLPESWDLSSSADEAMDWMTERRRGGVVG